MRGAWPRARAALADAGRAARISLSAPWLLLLAALPPLAAKYLPEPSSAAGLAAALTRIWPVLCAAAALTAFALLFRARLGWRPKSAGDETVMTFCYVLVALLISGAAGGFANERFELLMFAHVQSDFPLWARLSALFGAALQLAGLVWMVVLVLGLPAVPGHPDLISALARGLRALARRPAAAAAWIGAAAAGDWLLVRGASAAGGRFGEASLLLVAWARQALAYVLLCGAPLAAAESP
jgi:hypothetical protein